MQINIPTRAKSGYIETERIDKSGRKVKARDHMVASQGMLTTKEMEKEMMQVADEEGHSYDKIRIEYFNKGDAPIGANPMHRGRPARQTMYRHGERNLMFTGWSAMTEAEIAEWYRRQKELYD